MGMGSWAAIEGKEVFTYSNYEPEGRNNSNNVAEYKALEALLDWCLTLNEKEYWFHIHGDSKLVVQQMNKRWKIKAGLYVETALRCKEKYRLLGKRNQLRIDWIGREYNSRADELSKKELIRNKVEFKLQPQY
jgi:ribonuclease HI